MKKEISIGLAEVALLDARSCADIGDMSVSWWYEKVASGEAPRPVIRAPRCTRWRASHVADFWRRFGDRAGREGEVLARAKKASLAAGAKRIAESHNADA